jgi:hypothetical protein
LHLGENLHSSVCTTDTLSTFVEELQITLGEGPCVDAYDEGRAVAEPDLANPEAPRWTAFTTAALQAGVRSVFGYPVAIEGSRIGSMNLYRDRAGALSSDEHAYALTVAQVAGWTLLWMQLGLPEDDLAEDLRPGADFRMVVHQAAGMVATDLGVTLDEAYLRLRGRAFAEGSTLTSIAQAVVERRLRLDGR